MKADEKLDNLGIGYKEVVQENPTKGCEEAAEERGVETKQIVKSLIIESEGVKYHVCIPGNRTLSEKKFGAEYRMIPPEEAEEMTGFEPGTVHPFSTQLKHFIDERVFENSGVSHTVGEEKKGLIISSEDFKHALNKAGFNFEVEDIVVSNDKDFEEVREKGLEEESAKFVVNKGFRSVFLNLVDEYDKEKVLNLLKAFNREDKGFNREIGKKILDRAESQTHMQRLVEVYVEQGELPEQDSFDLESEVENVLNENPEAVEDLRTGKDSAVNYLIGQLMQKTNGKADAGKAQQKIREKVE